MDKRTKKLAQQGAAKVGLYHKVFSGPDGMAVLYDLMMAHGILNSTFRGDVNEMLIKEGERNVVLRILIMLKADPKLIMERIEAHEDEME